MRTARREVVPAAIAEMVRAGGIAALKPKAVAELRERYSVGSAEFNAQLGQDYSGAWLDCLQGSFFCRQFHITITNAQLPRFWTSATPT